MNIKIKTLKKLDGTTVTIDGTLAGRIYQHGAGVKFVAVPLWQNMDAPKFTGPSIDSIIEQIKAAG